MIVAVVMFKKKEIKKGKQTTAGVRLTEGPSRCTVGDRGRNCAPELQELKK